MDTRRCGGLKISAIQKTKPEETLESDTIPVEVFVGQELGSTGSIQALDENDSRQNSLLNEAEVLSLSYFSQVPNRRGGKYAKKFIEEYRRHKMSLKGWRANQLIKLVQGSKGVSSSRMVRKPGILARTVTNRNWRQNAELEGADIIE